MRAICCCVLCALLYCCCSCCCCCCFVLSCVRVFSVFRVSTVRFCCHRFSSRYYKTTFIELSVYNKIRVLYRKFVYRLTLSMQHIMIEFSISNTVCIASLRYISRSLCLSLSLFISVSTNLLKFPR